MQWRWLIAAAGILASTPAAHAEWYEASTGHFVVYSEQRPERLKEFAARLEKFDRAMRFLRGLPDEPIGKANRLTVYVVDDTDDVAKLAGNAMVAGFYRARAGGSMAVVPRKSGDGSEFDLNSQTVLLHEYTHHFMFSISPHTVYPAWYSEGFAETLATASFDKDGTVLIGSPPLYRAYEILAPHPMPVEKLLLADTRRLNAEQTGQLYGRGWMLSHYLLLSGARQGQLNTYIEALNAGKSPSDAAKAFGDLRALDKELARYKSQRLKGLRVPADKLQIAEVAIRKLSAGEAATMEVRIRSKNGVNAKTAPGVYADARKAAASYPNDPGAQIVLAETAYDTGDYAAAEAAADRALAADPKLVDGYVYKAMARMGVARKAGDKSKETWAAIRKIIASGNRIDPDDPEPLILYYTSYIAAGLTPNENACLGLLRAFDLAPQDDGLRMTAAAMFLQQNKPKDARVLLATLAYAPHGKGLAPLARQLIERIDAGDAAAAAKLLDTEEKEGDKPGSDTPAA
jgi:tetratricopeptide (TPR) repeat protein